MHYTYTIELENENAIEKLKSIAAQNGIPLLVKKKILPGNLNDSGERLASALNEISAQGGLKSFGSNPSEWQREQRKDRSLTGRD
jgi:hypothetical protein